MRCEENHQSDDRKFISMSSYRTPLFTDFSWSNPLSFPSKISNYDAHMPQTYWLSTRNVDLKKVFFNFSVDISKFWFSSLASRRGSSRRFVLDEDSPFFRTLRSSRIEEDSKKALSSSSRTSSYFKSILKSNDFDVRLCNVF